ncbi:hypothetical protein R6Z07F_001692 [Ovis aries]
MTSRPTPLANAETGHPCAAPGQVLGGSLKSPGWGQRTGLGYAGYCNHSSLAALRPTGVVPRDEGPAPSTPSTLPQPFLPGTRGAREITTQIVLLSSPDCLKPKEEKECAV